MPELEVGFRFKRGDARLLRALVERCKSEGLNDEHIALFSRAAEDARTGEPMRVVCSSFDEAQVFADGFTMYGISRPAIEGLSG